MRTTTDNISEKRIKSFCLSISKPAQQKVIYMQRFHVIALLSFNSMCKNSFSNEKDCYLRSIFFASIRKSKKIQSPPNVNE